ncbi:MAG: M48 family metallopeptidase [Telluria sp.]
MDSLGFSWLFVVFFALTVLARWYLAQRHIAHVLRHRAAVPAAFAATVPLAAHQKAADYTVARTRFGLVQLFWSSLTLIGFTLLGGLQLLAVLLRPLGDGLAYQLALLATFALVAGLLDLPLDYYRQFKLEERFGFNKMTPGLFWRDLGKNLLVGAALGLPLAAAVLWLMARAGALWWLYAWAVWTGFQLLVMLLFPTVIAPLFNKFTPLADGTVKERIDALLARVGFRAQGLFVMDGSKRSAHGNAYFSGFGAAKRIVFFDTLLDRLAPPEVEAVLAHELGHFKLRHIAKRLAFLFALSLGFLALLGYLKGQAWFYTGLGVAPRLNASNDALALILFLLVLPVFGFVLGPLGALASRRHEFEADAFAAAHSDARALVSALVKMYEDNASTLTPDPLHSAFYDSHPPAAVRIGQLDRLGAA